MTYFIEIGEGVEALRSVLWLNGFRGSVVDGPIRRIANDAGSPLISLYSPT